LRRWLPASGASDIARSKRKRQRDAAWLQFHARRHL
jgi:hypothetical protein